MKKIIFTFLFVFILILPIESFAQSAAPWADNTMNHRHQIIINSSQISGNTNLSNFPVLVSIQNGLNLNQNNIQSNGADVRFYDNSGNSLDFEIESFSTDPTSGSLTAWVRIPSLSATTDSTIWLYHGNTAAPDGQNPSGVWSSDYITVNHLSNLLDSTSNNNDGTNSGSVDIAGKIANARSFDGTNDRIYLPNTNGLNYNGNTLTLSAWVNSDTVSGGHAIFTKSFNANHGSPYMVWLLYHTSTYHTRMSSQTVNGGNVSTNTWQYVTATYDGSNMRLYFDGVQQSSTAKTGNIVQTAQAPTIGGRNTPNFNPNAESFNGEIDEVRFSNIAKSANWISTEYNNQNTPNTFLTIATMENRPVTPTVPTTTTPTDNDISNNGSIDGTIFLALLGFAFFFMLFPTTSHKGAYSIIAMMFHFSLSAISFSGQNVTINHTITDGITTWTSTSHIIQHNDFSISIFGWTFFLLAMFCLVTMLISFTQSAQEFKHHKVNSEM